MKKHTIFVLAITVIALANSPAIADVLYNIRDLGTLGGNESWAYSINENGQITGKAELANGETHAFIYDIEHSQMSDLGGGPYGNRSCGYGINDSGQVVGISSSHSDGMGTFDKAFLWTGDSMIGLGTSPDYLASFAWGVNNAGQVIGDSKTAFFYEVAKGRTEIPTFDGYSYSFGRGINNSSQAVGYCQKSYNSPYISAFCYDIISNTLTDLGTLETNTGRTNYSRAMAINDAGQIVGSSDYQAFIWDSTNGMKAISEFIIGKAFCAYGVNESGDVAGDGDYAWLWKDRVITNLNDLLPESSPWTLKSAQDISNSGQIVGYGDINGETHAYLLTPVPEPATILFLALGTVLLRRRR